MQPQQSRSTTGPLIGIFWVIQLDNQHFAVLTEACELSDAETYGEMLTYPHGHYDVWQGWQARGGGLPGDSRAIVAASEYEEWPRGRIVYEPGTNRFTLYADRQILRRPALLNSILQTFNLPPDRTTMKDDSHYRSTRRLVG